MKISLFGVGNAGVRIVDRLVAAEADRGRSFTDGNVLTFDTATTAFEQATAVPEERQVLLGETHPSVSQPAASTDSGDDADGDAGDADDDTDVDDGVGGDPEVGASVATAELPEIRRELDLVDETEVDAAMLVAGLGGGTGCGVGSVLLEELQSIYEEPVYVLGVLPAATEPDGRALTAARGLRTMVPTADAVFPVDNETWRGDADRIATRYEAINDVIVTRVVSLFAAGESASGSASEIRLDPADVRRTLGVGGVASIGQATFDLDTGPDGWLARIRALLGLGGQDAAEATDAATVKRLIRRALESTLTLPCDVASADRVLLLLSGPPGDISRKGFETGRYLLEQETQTVEVLAGDEPLAGAKTLTATVLLANVTDVPRIEALQQRAVAVQDDAPAATTDGHDEAAEDGTEFQFRDESTVAQRTEPDGDG
jgi:cell division GTPase FtsZ